MFNIGTKQQSYTEIEECRKTRYNRIMTRTVNCMTMAGNKTVGPPYPQTQHPRIWISTESEPIAGGPPRTSWTWPEVVFDHVQEVFWGTDRPLCASEHLLDTTRSCQPESEVLFGCVQETFWGGHLWPPEGQAWPSGKCGPAQPSHRFHYCIQYLLGVLEQFPHGYQRPTVFHIGTKFSMKYTT